MIKHIRIFIEYYRAQSRVEYYKIFVNSLNAFY